MCTCHYLSICPPAGFIQCQLPSLEGIVEAVFCNNQPAEFLGSVVQVFICRGILGIINCYCGIGSVGKENKWTSNKVGVFVVSKLSMIIWHLFHLASNLWSFLLSASEKEPPPLLHYCNIYFLVFATVGYLCSFTASMLVVVAFFQKTCQSSVWALMQNPELHCCSPAATCPAEFQSQAVSSVSSW